MRCSHRRRRTPRSPWLDSSLVVALALAGCKHERVATVVVAETGSGSGMGTGTGTGTGDGRPAVITDAILAANDAFVARLHELGHALTAAGTDCKQATAAIVAATPAITAAI